MEIGQQIQKLRADNNISQEDLAEKVYVSRQTISNWENNKNAKVLGVLSIVSITIQEIYITRGLYVRKIKHNQNT